MPRLDVPFGPSGPIIDLRLRVGPEDAADLVAAGRAVPPSFSVLGLVDTGAEITAIQGSLADWMGIPVSGSLEASSSVLGDETRVANVYRIQMTFGPLEAPDPPRWRTVHAVGVKVISAGVTVLIGRDLLATCRFTYDGRKCRFMMSY
jgi:hypothetical protein